MEDEEIINTDYNNNYLNGIICQECGFPLILESYTIIESKKIKIQLLCGNSDHTKINNIDFDDFKQLNFQHLLIVLKLLVIIKLIYVSSDISIN